MVIKTVEDLRTVKDLRDAFNVLIDDGKGEYGIRDCGTMFDAYELIIDDDEKEEDEDLWVPSVEISGFYTNYN